MKLVVRCIGGPEAGREWKFDGSGTITLGRDAGSMIRTPEGEQTISRRQSVILVQPPDVYVADAGSAHGTWVNSRMIGQQGQGERKRISDGAVIGVGKNGSAALFEIRIADADGPAGYGQNYGRGPAAGRQGYNGGPVGYDVPGNQSAGRTFGDKIGNTFQRLGSIFKDPMGQARSIAASKDAATGNILICMNLIAVLIVCIAVVIIINSRLGLVGNYVNVNWPVIILCILLAVAVNYYALAGLLLLSSRAFFGAKTTFAGMAGIIGIKAIWDAGFMLVSILIALLLPIVGIVIYGVSVLFTWMLLLFCYAEIVPLSGNRKFYSAFIAVVGNALLDGLIYALLFSSALADLFSLNLF